MSEELRDLRDPVLWRLQQAFWREEPTTDLAAVVRRSRTARALTEAELAAARRREPAALARVYSTYAPELFRMFEEAVGDRRQAEDLTGTAFVSAIEAVTFALDHGWLDDAGEEPVDRWAERLEDTQVLAALRELQPDQRDVLLLRMLGGLTAPEVADVLGRTTGAVKALQHRGLANLSRVLGLRKPPGSSNRQISRAEDPRTAGRG